jgi:hypothetical protein
MTNPRGPSRHIVQALRVAAAAAIALVIAEWWHLPHTNLAVWTTHMGISYHVHTTFQKGVERIVGRGGGILLGTLIVSLFGEQKLLALGLETVGLLAFFYAHFCGWLAYTYFNAALYLQAMLQLGDGDPSAAWVNGGWMFLAIVVGVVVAYVVSWITGAERDLSIVPGEGSLLPIRREPWGMRSRSRSRCCSLSTSFSPSICRSTPTPNAGPPVRQDRDAQHDVLQHHRTDRLHAARSRCGLGLGRVGAGSGSNRRAHRQAVGTGRAGRERREPLDLDQA